MRARFSAELVSRGPSPLRPSVWRTAADELGAMLAGDRDALNAQFRDPVNRRIALRRLPLNVVWLLGGIIVALAVRRWVIRWIDQRLLATASRRAQAWVVALRNLSRLVVPVVAAGLLFGALDPEGLVARAGEGRFFEIPGFVAVLIAAGWLAASLFAPRLEAHRLLPLDNAEARRGAWLVLALGGIVALVRIAQRGDHPLRLLAGHAVGDLLPAGDPRRRRPLARRPRRRQGAAAADGAAGAGAVADGAGGAALPALAGAARARRGGRRPAAGGRGLPAGGGVPRLPQHHDAGAPGRRHRDLRSPEQDRAHLPRRAERDARTDAGLIPVFVGTVVGARGAAAPRADLGRADAAISTETWAALNEGMTFGGMRISVSVILTLIAVFALGAALTRLIQTILRASVLPRTKLDPGGRNAVVAGVGYLGFVVAALAAVWRAGLDLSNVAIVAGALSVGHRLRACRTSCRTSSRASSS